MDKSASASGKHQKKCKDGTDITHGVSKDSIDNGGHEEDAQRLAVRFRAKQAFHIKWSSDLLI